MSAFAITDPAYNDLNYPFDTKLSTENNRIHQLGKQSVPLVRSLSTMDRWEIGIVRMEKFLNTLGYIPLVSTLFSSDCRAMLGAVELISGIAVGLFCIFAELFNRSNETYPSARAFALSIHGVSNIARAFFEFIPFIGNLACLLHDKAIEARIRYPIEDHVSISL